MRRRAPFRSQTDFIQIRNRRQLIRCLRHPMSTERHPRGVTSVRWGGSVNRRFPTSGPRASGCIPADNRRNEGPWLIGTRFLYKSLFTENSVATQKQYSTSINANKIQNTTIKSITSSFFTKLNYLLHLITKLAKAIYCGNVSYYKLILPSFKMTARQLNFCTLCGKNNSSLKVLLKRYDTTGCCFNVQSKADANQLNLLHGSNSWN